MINIYEETKYATKNTSVIVDACMGYALEPGMAMYI
jgi:hypothetical protein